MARRVPKRSPGALNWGDEDKLGLRSIVFTSQLPVAMWHDAVGDVVHPGRPVLDRVLENLQRVELQGNSMRKTSSGHTGTKAPREAK